MDPKERARKIIDRKGMVLEEYKVRDEKDAAERRRACQEEENNQKVKKENEIRTRFAGTGVLEIFEALLDLNPDWEVEYHKYAPSFEDVRYKCYGCQISLVTGSYMREYIDGTTGIMYTGVSAEILSDGKIRQGSRYKDGLYINHRKVHDEGNLDDLVSLAIANPTIIIK